ncbi:MAG TPA: hypothetical protein VE981_22830 [Planctomycetota bacterium]|nr:hypothetical protein [Planctomycetota bacterium]
MGDASRQAPERLHLLGLPKAFIELPPFGDVPRDDQEQRPIVIREEAHPDFDGERRPVFTAINPLLGRRNSKRHAPVLLQELLGIVSRVDVAEGSPEELLASIAEAFAAPAVDIQERASQVVDEERVPGVFDQAVERDSSGLPGRDRIREQARAGGVWGSLMQGAALGSGSGHGSSPG